MSSQFSFVLSYYSSFPMWFWIFFDKKAYFLQIDFISYIYWQRGSSQPFLVISQFSQFCAITAHISAERHLSKISYEKFYLPWPPLTFETIIFFHVKPYFISAQKPTVKSFFSQIHYVFPNITSWILNILILNQVPKSMKSFWEHCQGYIFTI